MIKCMVIEGTIKRKSKVRELDCYKLGIWKLSGKGKIRMKRHMLLANIL